MRLKMIAILLMIIGSISACSYPVVVPPEPLPITSRPHLPEITAEENAAFRSWNIELYKKFVVRDARLKGHISTLEAVIRSTHQD